MKSGVVADMPVAVRVYPLPPQDPDDDGSKKRKKRELPEEIIIFDTETRTDEAQSLLFGSYRVYIAGDFIEEGLFYPEDLTAKEFRALNRYARTHRPQTSWRGLRELRLLTLESFLIEFYRSAYKGRCLVVAFNHPFDLSRLAYKHVDGRGDFAGGFAFRLWASRDANGVIRQNRNRPDVRIRHIDSKRALIQFTSRMTLDKEDAIPDDSETGSAVEGYNHRGHYLDLKTLAFALTDEGHSLASACEAFEVKHGKKRAAQHGKLTAKYIDYNRRDVLATSELAFKLLEEYQKHEITLQPTKAFSPATIGKSYLRDMGIDPVLERQPKFPKPYLGFAQTAFFGGRTSAHIRKVTVPVVYTDFLSMYPTVNSLTGVWAAVTAREIRIKKHRKREVQTFLERFKPGDLFNPSLWKKLSAFVRVIPDGDILPSRSKYGKETNDWQVGLNHISAKNSDRKDALWYALPDVLASVLLTGRIPKIVDAFRVEAVGKIKPLKRIRLRSDVRVDPARQDFFKIAIEQRHLLPRRKDLSERERRRLKKALKVLANAAGYGIYAEMIRRDSDRKVRVKCRGLDWTPYNCEVAHPEDPGEYCFPPFASLITAAARLMLALLEHSVTTLGGTYAMEDTDSMAIVSTKQGGLIPCPGGPYRTPEGEAAVKALSWQQVETISKKFSPLNPYNRNAVLDSILKIESDNRQLKSKKPRQIYCYAISAKRYALFLKNKRGQPVLLRSKKNNEEDRWSEHGLGHLLNPMDIKTKNGIEVENQDREWIAEVWVNIIRKALGVATHPLYFEKYPAIGKIAVTSPAVMKSLNFYNEGKPYSHQIKPFNFLLTCNVRELGHPIGSNPERFHLISPYERDPRKWLKKEWIDEYSKNRYRITTLGEHGTRHSARVKTYGEVIEQYENHAESKCADEHGEASDQTTIGLLRRRHIQIDEIKYIGKESNLLEEVDAGSVRDPNSVYKHYPDIRRDEWITKVVPALGRMKIKSLVEKSKMSRRAIIEIRGGRSRPHLRNQILLISILRSEGLV
jgi:hypothetical protein